MAELEKRISGDWIELREKAGDLHSLLDLLALAPHELRGAADTLRHSVEQGLVEFKRTMLGPALVVLEAARYKSLNTAELEAQERALAALVLATLVQRLVCLDVIAVARPPAARAVDAEDLQIGAILADVNARVKTDPALRGHAAVKNILMLVQRYNAENRKMRELVPTIKQEMRHSFLTNFTRTFEEITGSIRKQYSVLLEEDAAAEASHREGFSLSAFPLKDLAPLLANQAREFSRFRSTLTHAREEKFKTREVLVRLYDGRQATLKLVEDEAREYRRLCHQVARGGGEGCAAALASGLRDEVVTVLDKQGR